MGSSEKLCLQWNDFKENITFSFKELREDTEFADVTLACEDGKQIEAHKVVLASSSPLFMELLKKNKHPHPLIYMRGLKSEDLVAVMDFLYYGEANVFQDQLDSFLALAEELRLKGLAGGAEETSESKKAPLKKEIGQKASLPQSNLNYESPSLHLASFDTTIAFTDDKVSVVDPQDLDEQIKSMFTKSDVRTNNGQGRMATCNVCGKEDSLKHLPRYIEAYHITGVSHPCEICGKVYRSKDALRKHRLTYHYNKNLLQDQARC